MHLWEGSQQADGSDRSAKSREWHSACKLVTSCSFDPIGGGIRDKVVLFFWEVCTEHRLATQEGESFEDPLSSSELCDLSGGDRGDAGQEGSR